MPNRYLIQREAPQVSSYQTAQIAHHSIFFRLQLLTQ
jgi:hypothetical protein